ncbi:MAG: J domain-containing protein [Bryobacterales bacterium]|nr:J domain-containing protein [Bryobacterales bacterium]
MGKRASASRGAARFPAKENGSGASPFVSLRSPFAVLGVSRDASAAQVKQAYRRLCARYHPDIRARGNATENPPESSLNSLPSGDARIDEAAAFLEIQRAYHTLKNRYARAQWERAEQEREWEQERRRVSRVLEAGSDSVREASLLALPPARPFVELVMRTCAALLPMRAEAFTRPISRFWLVVGGCALAALLFWWSSSREESPKAVVRIHRESSPADGSPRKSEPPATPKGSIAATSAKGAAVPQTAIHATGDTGLAENGDQSVPRSPETMDDPRPGTLAGSLKEDSAIVAESAAHQPGDGPPARNVSVANLPELRETASRASALPSSEASSKTAEWRGRWVAVCIAHRGTDLYRGFLEIADQGSFRWMSLGSGAAGAIDQLAVNASSGGDVLLRSLPRNVEDEDGMERRSAQGAVSAVATLEHSASSGRWLRWHASLAGDEKRASGRRSSETAGGNQQVLVCPCPRWRLFVDDGDGAFEGLWVLPAGEKEAEGALAAEYAELRMTRKTDGLAGQFVGRYRVPVDSMPPEMRFGFVAPLTATGWHAWQNADGVLGKVLLAPIGRSRLAVLWKRGSIPSGRPGLSGGIAVLRRME